MHPKSIHGNRRILSSGESYRLRLGRRFHEIEHCDLTLIDENLDGGDIRQNLQMPDRGAGQFGTMTVKGNLVMLNADRMAEYFDGQFPAVRNGQLRVQGKRACS